MPLTTYQTTTPYESLADFLARLLDPDGSADEGLYWTASSFSTGTSYPAFLALVKDDSGRIWPCGATSSVAIDFVATSGTGVGLYLVPFSESELPGYVSGQIGDFTLVADTSAPDDALLIGTGDVSSSSFDNFSESGSARVAVTASSLLPLTDLTGLASGDLLKYDGSSRFEPLTCTAAGRALLDDADAAAQRSTLGVVIGTDVEAYDPTLAALAALATAANKIIRATGTDTFELVDMIDVTDYSGTSTVVGWSTPMTFKQIRYNKIGKMVTCWFVLDGTSNSTTTTFTLPYSNGMGLTAVASMGYTMNAGTAVQQGEVYIPNGSSTVNLRLFDASLFSGSGQKSCFGQIAYATA